MFSLCCMCSSFNPTIHIHTYQTHNITISIKCISIQFLFFCHFFFYLSATLNSAMSCHFDKRNKPNLQIPHTKSRTHLRPKHAATETENNGATVSPLTPNVANNIINKCETGKNVVAPSPWHNEQQAYFRAMFAFSMLCRTLLSYFCCCSCVIALLFVFVAQSPFVVVRIVSDLTLPTL